LHYSHSYTWSPYMGTFTFSWLSALTLTSTYTCIYSSFFYLVWTSYLLLTLSPNCWWTYRYRITVHPTKFASICTRHDFIWMDNSLLTVLV
jgi:hypothetical protein